jgi:hypothetical protein
MKTYQIVPEERSNISRWVIQVVEDGKAIPGALSNHYETKQDAQYWVDRMTTQDKAEGII